MSTYSEKLKDPRWQKRRLEIMKRDEFTCQECGSKTNTLTVHHRFYVYGYEPWEYEDDELVTLCESCHSEIQVRLRVLRKMVGSLSLSELDVVGQAIHDFLNSQHAADAPRGPLTTMVDRLLQGAT